MNFNGNVRGNFRHIHISPKLWEEILNKWHYWKKLNSVCRRQIVTSMLLVTFFEMEENKKCRLGVEFMELNKLALLQLAVSLNWKSSILNQKLQIFWNTGQMKQSNKIWKQIVSAHIMYWEQVKRKKNI